MIPSSRNRPQCYAPTRHRLRPRLDALEGRLLLTAGQLDSTFGSGGVVLTNFPTLSKGGHGTGGEAQAVQIQSDGKIVVAGDGPSGNEAIARYNPDGSLDSTFGSGGSVSSVSFFATMGFVLTIMPRIRTSAAIVQLMMMAVTVAAGSRGTASHAAQNYIDSANRQMDKGNYTAAIANYKRALQFDGNNGIAKNYLGRARRAMQAENEILANRR